MRCCRRLSFVSRPRSRTSSHSAARRVTHLLDVKNGNIDGRNLQGSGGAEETGELNGPDVAKLTPLSHLSNQASQ